MAHLTNGAVDSLLGVLSKVVKDEAALLGGVEGDIQFIRDEMDSMNGFLLHLTKSKTPHNDQLRAWMKQVRDVTYVADDCINLYMRDLVVLEHGLWPRIRHIPKRLRTMPARHRLAKKIHKLKDRVREVGERRQRYDVKLPEDQHMEESPLLIARKTEVEEKRDEFLRTLEDVVDDRASAKSLEEAINMLPLDLGTDAASAKHLYDIVEKCVDGRHVASIKMLLRALYAHPYGTLEEVKDLSKKLENRGTDVAKVVMIFCYSKLSTHCKSCLQYLVTMGEEDKISRSCLVRRWAAEGLLPRVVEPPLTTMEEPGELCFNELVFRGFLRPPPPPPPPPPPRPADHPPKEDDDVVGTCSLNLKSCVVDDAVKSFIPDISKSDNFVVDLPTHLRHQLEIRKMVQRSLKARNPKQQPLQQQAQAAADKKPPHPMDGMVKLLKGLPEEYRLNVIDLGGCQSLEKLHLKSICKVTSLKYLSLRNTNVSRLPKKMKDLWQLETLDIRDTNNMPATAMRRIYLHGLKHLLAGGNITTGGGEGKNNEAGSISTLLVPRRIGKKTETLRHVRIKDGRADLQRIGSLEQLRKLGVVLDGREDNIKLLLTTIGRRSDTLRSLSVWITAPPPEQIAGSGSDGVFVILDSKGNSGDGVPVFSLPSRLESLNLNCFKGKSSNTAGSIPQWIKQLENLSKITLHHSLLNEEGLRELGKMKRLRCLKLCRESYIEPNITLEKDDFKELRLLVLHHVSGKMTNLIFKDGATPMLEKIGWNYNRNTTSVEITAGNISGIEYLKFLREIRINDDVNIFKPSLARY
uniref:NBS-LRR type resistance protein-like n=1 Tax=Oryza sativa subsp. indica TaxID=39946 RepID=A0A679BAN3_ORYSI|nr:NBS-LRR type resistance protein-like [Oryza sativa Indica Group]